MDENKNEEVDVDLAVDTDEEESEPEPTETTDWEARSKKLEEKAIAQRERTRALKVEVNRLKKAQEAKAERKTGELDERQLDYLDLRGISDEEEIEIVQRFVNKTGMSVREAIKDEYVQSKLDTLRAIKAVQSAMPSSTKRSGNQVNDLSTDLARFEQTGELPEDFERRSAVVNATVQKQNTNKPSWHK